MRVNRLRSMAALLLFLAMCLGTGIFGRLLTGPSIRSGWYGSLVKPPFTPPAWVFGPVWSILYLLMAVSAWMVWTKQRKHRVRIPLAVFFAQLVLNVLWSALFFAQKMPGWALAEIVLLWLSILLTVFLFWEISRPAAILLVPYALWVLYAMILNGTIWYMNHARPPFEGMVVV